MSVLFCSRDIAITKEVIRLNLVVSGLLRGLGHRFPASFEGLREKLLRCVTHPKVIVWVH